MATHRSSTPAQPLASFTTRKIAMSSADLRPALDHAFTFAVYVLGSRQAALAALEYAAELVSPDARPLNHESLLHLVRDAIGRIGARARPASETLPAV